jgi:hypothetical protein
LKYIEIHSKYNEVHYNYIQMHWKNIQILWFLLKFIYLPLKFICIFWYTLEYLSNTLQYLHYISLAYFIVPLINYDMLPYTLKLSCNRFILHFFVLSLYYFQNCHGALLFYKNVLALAMKYLLELNKSGIFHEFHKLYLLFKYLNL